MGLEEEPLSVPTVSRMQEVYNINPIVNSEIKFRWIRLRLRAKDQSVLPLAAEFVSEQGRMKFIRPIYREMYEWEVSRPLALETFHKNKSGMMAVSVGQV